MTKRDEIKTEGEVLGPVARVEEGVMVTEEAREVADDAAEAQDPKEAAQIIAGRKKGRRQRSSTRIVKPKAPPGHRLVARNGIPVVSETPVVEQVDDPGLGDIEAGDFGAGLADGVELEDASQDHGLQGDGGVDDSPGESDYIAENNQRVDRWNEARATQSAQSTTAAESQTATNDQSRLDRIRQKMADGAVQAPTAFGGQGDRAIARPDLTGVNTKSEGQRLREWGGRQKERFDSAIQEASDRLGLAVIEVQTFRDELRAVPGLVRAGIVRKLNSGVDGARVDYRSRTVEDLTQEEREQFPGPLTQGEIDAILERRIQEKYATAEGGMTDEEVKEKVREQLAKVKENISARVARAKEKIDPRDPYFPSKEEIRKRNKELLSEPGSIEQQKRRSEVRAEVADANAVDRARKMLSEGMARVEVTSFGRVVVRDIETNDLLIGDDGKRLQMGQTEARELGLLESYGVSPSIEVDQGGEELQIQELMERVRDHANSLQLRIESLQPDQIEEGSEIARIRNGSNLVKEINVIYAWQIAPLEQSREFADIKTMIENEIITKLDDIEIELNTIEGTAIATDGEPVSEAGEGAAAEAVEGSEADKTIEEQTLERARRFDIRFKALTVEQISRSTRLQNGLRLILNSETFTSELQEKLDSTDESTRPAVVEQYTRLLNDLEAELDRVENSTSLEVPDVAAEVEGLIEAAKPVPLERMTETQLEEFAEKMSAGVKQLVKLRVLLRQDNGEIYALLKDTLQAAIDTLQNARRQAQEALDTITERDPDGESIELEEALREEANRIVTKVAKAVNSMNEGDEFDPNEVGSLFNEITNSTESLGPIQQLNLFLELLSAFVKAITGTPGSTE